MVRQIPKPRLTPHLVLVANQFADLHREFVDAVIELSPALIGFAFPFAHLRTEAFSAFAHLLVGLMLPVTFGGRLSPLTKSTARPGGEFGDRFPDIDAVFGQHPNHLIHAVDVFPIWLGHERYCLTQEPLRAWSETSCIPISDRLSDPRTP